MYPQRARRLVGQGRAAAMVADEVRSLSNGLGSANGLICWDPVLNTCRDVSPALAALGLSQPLPCPCPFPSALPLSLPPPPAATPAPACVPPVADPTPLSRDGAVVKKGTANAPISRRRSHVSGSAASRATRTPSTSRSERSPSTLLPIPAPSRQTTGRRWGGWPLTARSRSARCTSISCLPSAPRLRRARSASCARVTHTAAFLP